MNELKSAHHETNGVYTSLDIRIEEELGVAWYYMNAKPRPCYTWQLAYEMWDWFNSLAAPALEKEWKPDFVVMASKVPGIFNLGGDLHLMSQAIKRRDRDTLMSYATLCNDILYRIYSGHNDKITTIGLVQGDALGGGLEGAIANEVLIVEKSAKLGLPDILFNLFPGAGAYNLLARKVGISMAERIILSGRHYTAEEMFDMGIIDILADDGQGEMALYNYIKKEKRARNGYRGFRKVKRLFNPLSREELRNAVAIWVDTALNLEPRDLKNMERLVARQFTKMCKQAVSN